MNQPRNNKGQFLPKPKLQIQPQIEVQNEKVMLIEEHEHIQTEMGIYPLSKARQLAKQYGGSYIFKPV
jgi:hypothetical protein